MGPDDIAEGHRLSVAVGWPHREEDWAFSLSVGHGLVATIDDRIVGTAMWWVFDPGVAKLGMVIVDPALQRAGIGRLLMNEVLQRLAERTVLLVATKAGAPLYRKLGFVDAGLIGQHQGIATKGGPHDLRPGTSIRPGLPQDLPHLIELDRQANGHARPQVIETLLTEGRAVVLEAEGRTEAFAIIRRFGRGDTIGPVVARDRRAAKALMAALIDDRQGSFVRADVPVEAGLSDWLGNRGLANVSEVLTMARGTPPEPSTTFHRFALVSQALG